MEIDRGVMLAALEYYDKHPLEGVSAACLHGGVAPSDFARMVKEDDEYKRLYELALARALQPVEERHLDTMAKDPKDAASRRAFLAAQRPGLYTPRPERPAAAGTVNLNLTAQVTKIALALVADLPRARAGDNGQVLPDDVPVELLVAGGSVNELPMLVDEREAERVERVEQAPDGEG